MSSELLTHHFFTPLIGSLFRIEMDGMTIDLRLESVTPFPPLRRRKDSGETVRATEIVARSEPFSLTFLGPFDQPLPQRTYRMTRESASDSLDIFIVPVGREHDGFVYQAVFG